MSVTLNSDEYYLLNNLFKRISIDDINKPNKSTQLLNNDKTEIINDILENINEYTKVYGNINSTTSSILDIIYGTEHNKEEEQDDDSLILNRISYNSNVNTNMKSSKSIDDYEKKYSPSINKLYIEKFQDTEKLDNTKRLHIYIYNIYNKIPDSTYSETTVELLKQIVNESKLNDLNNNIKFLNLLKSDSILFDKLKNVLITKYFNKNRKQKSNEDDEIIDKEDYSEEEEEEEYEDDDNNNNDRFKRLICKTDEYKQYIIKIIEDSSKNSSNEDDIAYLISFYKELKLMVSASEYNEYREKFLNKYRKQELPKDEFKKDSNDIINSLYENYNIEKYNNYLNSII
ncbi:hypothetical protein HANVADRAFT_4644 [Hanseniaspora valbyensis NRRL Y-1626]|uniref:Uncharacterized protein n=1 Tax=Hanseniaspora valbyensis NRRL Y-1626 TaxID=766949 RepID=A0A1B7SWI1_9ASCO|nr:hypothetical protein HANVADRAFT_4644 [Hanseniaspora valbyensis NRRL Y-1626]